eukprot:scaffold25398_cov65-Cyclotella_meneghiniana.AAC.3
MKLRRHKNCTAIERSTTELYVHRQHTAGIEPATIRSVQWSCRGLNPGLCACKAHDLPLIYNPDYAHRAITSQYNCFKSDAFS